MIRTERPHPFPQPSPPSLLTFLYFWGNNLIARRSSTTARRHVTRISHVIYGTGQDSGSENVTVLRTTLYYGHVRIRARVRARVVVDYYSSSSE